jgi:hypothetical protein
MASDGDDRLELAAQREAELRRLLAEALAALERRDRASVLTGVLNRIGAAASARAPALRIAYRRLRRRRG